MKRTPKIVPACHMLIAAVLLASTVSASPVHPNQASSSSLTLSPWEARQLLNVTVPEKSPLHLACFNNSELASWPGVKIRWLRGKKKKYFYLINTSSSGSRPSSSPHLSSPIEQNLTISRAVPSDGGWYACMGNIYNELNQSSYFIKWFHVRVRKSVHLPINPEFNEDDDSDEYDGSKFGFSNVTKTSKFTGWKYLISLGSMVFNFSIVAFCVALFGCFCCGGCLCF